jgi:hypothetical protein
MHVKGVPTGRVSGAKSVGLEGLHADTARIVVSLCDDRQLDGKKSHRIHSDDFVDWQLW